MLWIIGLLVILELHKYCQGNMAQYGQWKLDLYRPNLNYSRHKPNMLYQRNNIQYDQDSFGSKSKPDIFKEMDSIEESSTIFDNKRLLRRDSRNSLHHLRTSYPTENNLQDPESQNPIKILHRDFIVSKHDQNTNQNTIGLKNVRFFRRNNHWKPKRLIDFNPRTNQHDRFINSGYDQNKDHQKYNEKQNQNAIDSQVYSDFCIVMSNTITIHNSGLKLVHNFKAPEYLPPVDRITPNYHAPEYLPPNTRINDIPNNEPTTTSYHPDERGDVPEEENPTEEPDDLTTVEEPSISVTTFSRVIPPTSENTSPIVTTTTTYSSITSESSNLGEESLATLARTTSFKGLEYLPPDNNKTTFSVMTQEPDPAMARPVQPEPDDTTSSNRYQTEEHRLSTFIPFTEREYFSPATTTTSIDTTTFSGVAPAMAMPVPPEPEDKKSTSSPLSSQTDDFTSAETTTTPTTTSTLTISDSNPFKLPDYLPPKMIPVLPPVPAMAMPVLPEAEGEPSTSSTLSTSTDDFKPAEKSTNTLTAIIVPDTNPFKAPDYLPPKMASKFPPAPAMAIPVPKPEDFQSTSLPSLAETSTSISFSTPIITKINTFKAPDYLPPKMVPVLPVQEMAVPAPKPDHDRDPNDNPNIDLRSFAADGPRTPRTTKTAD